MCLEGEDLKPNRFNGECYARVKTKRYDTPMGGRALANMSQGRLILVSELISEGKMFQTWGEQRYSQVIIRIKIKTGMGKSGVGYGVKQVGANGYHEGIFPSGVYENKTKY